MRVGKHIVFPAWVWSPGGQKWVMVGMCNRFTVDSCRTKGYCVALEDCTAS